MNRLKMNIKRSKVKSSQKKKKNKKNKLQFTQGLSFELKNRIHFEKIYLTEY